MEEPKLDKERHIKYWHRCLKTLLPTEYTSSDSSRMTWAFFILSALDLLGAGPDTFPESDRANIRKWILHCQHPSGGFCGSPNHRYPEQYYLDVGNGGQQMDPANLPATCFALLALSFVGNFEDLERDKCLDWLRRLQRDDGSFGELITQEGVIQGGRDMRYCYVATAIRWMLGAEENAGKANKANDIDVEKLVNHIRSGQTYDGGFSESSQHEAHAGYTYCAISALSILDRLPKSSSQNTQNDSRPGLTNLPATIRWLTSRQLNYDEEEDRDEDEDPPKPQQVKLAGVYEDEPPVPDLSLESRFVGFNGRCNKRADTCYAFWVVAALDILGKDNTRLVNTQAIRRFLFEQTQHRIGGFGKGPGNPPDIYHSYLGLVALAVMKEPGLKPVNSALCISAQQGEEIKKLRGVALVPKKVYWKNGYCFSIRQDDPEFEKKIAGSEDPPKFLTDRIESVSNGMSSIKI